MADRIEEQAKRDAESFDIVIICEMAKRFLEQESKRRQKAGGVNG